MLLRIHGKVNSESDFNENLAEKTKEKLKLSTQNELTLDNKEIKLCYSFRSFG